MNRPQHKQAVIALFLLGLISLSIAFVYAGTIAFSTHLMEKQSVARADSSLDLAISELSDFVSDNAKESSEEVYDSLLLETTNDNAMILDVRNKTSFFEKYIDILTQQFATSESTIEYLENGLIKDEFGTLKISDSCNPKLVYDFDANTSEIKECLLKNIVIQYYIGDRFIKERACVIRIPEPFVTFADESIDFMEYCLWGAKGVYITGDTSTIVGSICAGTHTYEEGREAEVAFGEKGPYGGVNFLTTQVGIYGDSIVSTGDINLKGAFVLFGSDDDKISLFANTLNEIENYPSKTKYEICGERYFRDGSVEFVNEENYNEVVETMQAVFGEVKNISSSYYSRDDENYEGTYEKIISASDVTISEDFTGVIIARGNVLIEADCNVEGVVISGDRIYIYGNNNIVSNKDLIGQMVNEEQHEEGSDETQHISKYIDVFPK